MGGCIYTCYENFKQKTIPSTQITHLFALRTIQSGLLDTSEARKKYHERISQNTSSYQSQCKSSGQLASSKECT